MKNLSFKAILFVGVLVLSVGSFVYLNAVAKDQPQSQTEFYKENSDNDINNDNVQQADFPEVQLLKKIIEKSRLF